MDKIEQTKKIINLTQLAIQEIDKLIKTDLPNEQWLEFMETRIEYKQRIEVLDSLIEKWS
jgi:hypothetical protein